MKIYFFNMFFLLRTYSKYSLNSEKNATYCKTFQVKSFTVRWIFLSQANLALQEARLRVAMGDLSAAQEALNEKERALQEVNGWTAKNTGCLQKCTLTFIAYFLESIQDNFDTILLLKFRINIFNILETMCFSATAISAILSAFFLS